MTRKQWTALWIKSGFALVLSLPVYQDRVMEGKIKLEEKRV